MSSFSTVSQRSLILILIIAGFICLMAGNNLVSLTHPDEVFYAQTAREMIQHNSWMTPYLFDHPQFEKPIFFYWLLIIGFKLFGATPFVARFWPALFGMGSVLVAYWMAWMLFKNKRLAFLAGLILCTSFIHIGMSRAVLTDMVFSFWVIIALACFYWSYTSPRHKDLGIILFFICGAVGVLTKGILGILIPLSVVHFYLRYKKDLGFLDSRAALWGLLIFLIIAVPWHILMYRLYGQPFIDEYWYNVHVRRIFEAEHRSFDTWHFYIGVMLAGMFPWAFFLVPAVLDQRKLNENKTDRAKLLFLFFWILGVFIPLQIAHSKLASYILPVFPALAIFIAYYLHKVIEERKKVSQRGFQAAGYILAVGIMAASIALVFVAKHYVKYVPDFSPIYLLSGLWILCAVVIGLSLLKKKLIGMIAGITGVTIAVLITFSFVYHFAEPWVSCKAISEALMEADKSDSTVLANKFYVRAIRFYTDRKLAVIDGAGKTFFSKHPLPMLNNDELVKEFLRTQPVTYSIVRKSTLATLERVAKEESYQMTTVKQIGDKYLVKIEAPAKFSIKSYR